MSRRIRSLAHVGVATCLMLQLFGAFGAVGVESQAREEIVSPTAKISRDSYKTWSLFLMCNPDWTSAERSRDVANLYWRFRAFGDAIGKENLAVWFWKEKTSTSNSRLAENIDVARSAEYCRALGKKPSEGPYLVVTTAYPDLASFPQDRAVLELGGLEPAAQAKLLNSLTDQLLLERKVDVARLAIEKRPAAAAPSAGPQPGELSFWIQFLEVGRRTMIGLGCAVKLSIAAGPLNAELRGCAQ